MAEKRIDVCGETGEYYSFVFDGPIFRKPVEFEIVGRNNTDYHGAHGTSQICYRYLELDGTESHQLWQSINL